jgi:dihydroorotase
MLANGHPPEMTMNDFQASYDLVLKGGRIIDPATSRDETTDIAFADGKVSEIGRDIPANGAETVDLRGLVVVPGLIDLHTHVYWGGHPSVSTQPRWREEAGRRRSSTPAVPGPAFSTAFGAM